MIYKLMHKLFGWDYVAWKNSCDQGIARLHRADDGSVFYWRYKSTKLLDAVKTKEQVLWLTCSPDKWGMK